MNKFLLSAIALLTCVCVYARDYSIKVDTTSVPSAAQEVLVQRFTQMLENGGFSLTDEAAAPVMNVSVEEKERMETSGTAVVLDVTAEVKDVATTFTVKGLGSDADDAYLRAAKQILPQSKAAKVFLSAVKMVVHE